jgi:predicted nucleic acid-binding protein
MTLVDSSVWVDHFRKGDSRLAELLEESLAATHECVIGELMCGSMRDRGRTLEDLNALPRLAPATSREVLHLIDREKLFGLGLGWVDVHLLAAARLSHALLYTRDRALAAAAQRLGIGS